MIISYAYFIKNEILSIFLRNTNMSSCVSVERYKPVQSPAYRRNAFIIRHASLPHAVKQFHDKTPFHDGLQIIDDPLFPVPLAVEILHGCAKHAYGTHPNSYLRDARFSVLQEYWERHGQQIIAGLKSKSLKKRALALLDLEPFSYHIPASQRREILPLLYKMPAKVETEKNYYIDTASFANDFKLKILICDALDEIDKMLARAGLAIEDFEYFIREALEFFPSSPMYIKDPLSGNMVESRVSRDYDKTGTSLETMRKVLRMPDITEDQIKRVHSTQYCQRGYGELSEYRDIPVFRCGGSITRQMPRPESIPEQMRTLVSWVNTEKARMLHPLIRARMFYYEYDKIHPFTGRTKHVGRFFMNKILLQGKDGIFYPPLVNEFFFLMPNIFRRRAVQDHFGMLFDMNEESPTESDANLVCFYSKGLIHYFNGILRQGMAEPMLALSRILHEITGEKPVE